MTSKRWLRTSGIRLAKFAFAFCLFMSTLSFGSANPDTLLNALKGRKPEAQLKMLSVWSSKGYLDPDIADLVDDLQAKFEDGKVGKNRLGPRVNDIIGLLEIESRVHNKANVNDPVGLAKQIKSNPIYRDPGAQETANWLDGAASKLSKLKNPMSCDAPETSTREFNPSGDWAKFAVYGLLGAGLLAFLIFAISRFTWAKRLERKAKALLDEDEPERTVDEWLELANRLESENKFREAVRCLYLACLLKIDEARIARFERSQTNWEHLARIESSARRPAELDFRPPTKAFDEIWYGMRVKGAEDVAKFRTWYREITEMARAKAA